MIKNPVDYSLYECPFSHVEKECGHELHGPEGYEEASGIKAWGVWCPCGFRGPAFVLEPEKLGLRRKGESAELEQLKQGRGGPVEFISRCPECQRCIDAEGRPVNHPTPAAVPEGYALVPITPSPEQLKAMVGWRELDEDERLPLESEMEIFSRVYTCGVIAATPQPNTQPPRQPPWTDYAGNTIKEGDRIGHPSGQKGRVYYTQAEDVVDAWRVDYDDGADSPLALQIGDKGRAVVLE